MFKYREGDIRAGKAKIHYYRTGGDKPPFILLHGATDNGLCWSRAGALLANDYDLVMPDAQGHGLSSRMEVSSTYADAAPQIAELARQLKLKKPLVMGHSMGGMMAVNLAVEYPNLPRAIILEDPPWLDPPPPEMAEEEKKQMEIRRGWLMNIRNRPLAEREEAMRKEGWAEEEVGPWAISKGQFDPTLFAHLVIDPRPYTEMVPRLDCPTLLILAERGIVTRAVAEKATRLWKSRHPFRRVQIMGAGHNIRREQFDKFWEALAVFLREDVK